MCINACLELQAAEMSWFQRSVCDIATIHMLLSRPMIIMHVCRRSECITPLLCPRSSILMSSSKHICTPLLVLYHLEQEQILFYKLSAENSSKQNSLKSSASTLTDEVCLVVLFVCIHIQSVLCSFT